MRNIEAGDVTRYTIVVMGLTGSGKSSFISLLTGQDVGIGHGLESCTRRSNQYTFNLDPKRVVHLIDTPGFDDTGTKDSEVLKDIAFFLNAMYNEKFYLSGVILLHRITDQRMSGSSLRNLRILQKLCGESAYSHVSLVSAMWGKLQDEGIGISREQGLVENANFWAPMKAKGSMISRHNGTVESARQIIEAAIARGTTVLDIQRQMVDRRLDLDETAVGEYLGQELVEARKKYEKELAELEQALREATEDNDAQLIKMLKEQQEAQTRLLSQTKTEQRELRVPLKALDREREKQISEAQDMMARDQRRNEDEIFALRKEIETLQGDLLDTNVGRSHDMTRVIHDRENMIMNNRRLEHDALVQEQSYDHQLRSIETQITQKKQELQMRQKRSNSWKSGLGVFMNLLFGGMSNSPPDEGGEIYRVVQREPSLMKYQSMSERTFRSNTWVLERKRN